MTTYKNDPRPIRNIIAEILAEQTNTDCTEVHLFAADILIVKFFHQGLSIHKHTIEQAVVAIAQYFDDKTPSDSSTQNERS